MIYGQAEGYIIGVEPGITEDGNWYLRFYLVDETGAEWLCKTLNEEHKDFKAGNHVSIIAGTWRKWEANGKIYSYLEVEKMNKSEGKDYQRQKTALDVANKVLTGKRC